MFQGAKKYRSLYLDWSRAEGPALNLQLICAYKVAYMHRLQGEGVPPNIKLLLAYKSLYMNWLRAEGPALYLEHLPLCPFRD